MKSKEEIAAAIEAQAKYCKEMNLPHFAPYDGICFYCRCQIYEHISVSDADSHLISGCPVCRRSFVE